MKAALAVIVAAFIAVAWFSYQSGAKYEDAYRAMQARQPSMVEAMIEGDPPKGMPFDKRLHPVGSLMRLRYEQIDKDGSTIATYEARALVPPLPYFGMEAPTGEFGGLECRSACQENLKKTGAVVLQRSGNAGLPEEWLLRMPQGKAWDVGQRGALVQDIGQPKGHSIPVSRLRVTLLEVCKARVRVGSETHLEFHPYAMVPIPKEFRTTRWVQIEGCEAMMKSPPAEEQLGPPVAPPVQVKLRPAWPDPAPKWNAVRPSRAGGPGTLALFVDEGWLAAHRRPLAFRMLRACRYESKSNSWVKLEIPKQDGELMPGLAIQARTVVAYRFPGEYALFFGEWAEVEKDGKGLIHSALVPSGAVSCRETDLPPPQAGELVACVPEGVVSATRLVPDPDKHCTK